MEYIYTDFRTVMHIQKKFTAASLSGDFSKITQEDKDALLAVMLTIAKIWKGIMTFFMSLLSHPILIFNKYVFCKLTHRPFVWLTTYTFDLIALGLYLYIFGWHIKWLNVQNEGFGLEAIPSQEMMYV